MILGMTPAVLFHVVLSLVGIGSGLVVLYGLVASKRLGGWTALFLATTLATTVTGFLLPFVRFLPSHATGIVSLLVLAATIPALYVFRLAGRWRKVYVIGAVVAPVPQRVRAGGAAVPEGAGVEGDCADPVRSALRDRAGDRAGAVRGIGYRGRTQVPCLSDHDF